MEVKNGIYDNVSEFFFFRGKINDEPFNKNLSRYKIPLFRDILAFDHDFGIERSYWLEPNMNATPDFQYFSDIEDIKFKLFTKNNIDNQERIGNTYQLTTEYQFDDNFLEFSFKYNGVWVEYKYNQGDEISYIEIKDSTVENRIYDVIYVSFPNLTFYGVEDSSWILDAANIEIKLFANKI